MAFAVGRKERSCLVQSKIEKNRLKFRIDAKDGKVITDVLKDRGWHQVEGESEAWDLFWCEAYQVKGTLNSRLGPFQRMPHFSNFYELSRKNHLSRNLLRYKKALLKEGKVEEAAFCDCVPPTFELPGEQLMFHEYYRKNQNTTWIVKPAVGCQGRGIFLFKRLRDLNEWKRNRDWMKEVVVDGEKELQPDLWIIQKYIENPYLLAGRKFDLRIYVLVMAFNPLRIWIAREGFARICGTQYTMKDLKDTFIHLTNTHIQQNRNLDPSKHGCKWRLTQLRQYLVGRHGSEAVENLFQYIARVVITSLQSVQKAMINSLHCFELYGYDIILDENLKPYLLEVNASPSLMPTSESDYVMKYNLLLDTINILDLEKEMLGKEIRVGGLDLVWDGGPILAPCPAANSCGPSLNPNRLNVFLGCLNDREDNLTAVKEWKMLILNQTM